MLLSVKKENEHILLTKQISSALILKNKIYQTVEAEIKVVMLSQRAREAESRVKNRLSNGPLRAQSNVGDYRVFCDVGHTSVAGDMLVS